MSAVVIAGNTSGTITLQAPAVSGSTTLNLPTISGGTIYTSTAAGDLYLGTTDTTGASGQTDRLRVVGTTGPNCSISQFRYTNDNGGPNVRFYKSRSTTVGGFTALQNGDNLGNYQSFASDGTAWFNAGQFGYAVDGTVSTGVVPTTFAIGTTNSAGGQSTQLSVRANGNLEFNSGYGAPAVAYGCRAWVNFNGTGTVAIRGSGNVTSITDNGTGDYTVNFTTAMPDANYSANTSSTRATLVGSADVTSIVSSTAPTSSAYRFLTQTGSGAVVDSLYTCVSVFR